MELEFEFDINDWTAFQKNYLRNSKHFKRTKFIVLAMLPTALLIVSIINLFRDKFDLVAFIFFILISVIWIFFYSKRFETTTIRRSRKIFEEGDNSGLLGKHKLILNDEGVKLIASEIEQFTKWSGIKKLVETEDYYFLYNTSLTAVIIPKNKLDINQHQLREFLNDKLVLELFL